jgi:hypothetical protein
VLLFLVGCLEPFAEDRHDLAGLRIVGMRAESAEDEWGDLLWSASAFVWDGDLGWSRWPENRTYDWTAEDEGGFEARGCCDPPGTLTLTVVAEGETESGQLELDEYAENPEQGAVDLAIEGDQATVSLPEAPASATTHWMAPAGEFEETGAHSTTYTAPGDGIWPVVALTYDGHGGVTWTVIDVVVGTVGPTLEIGNRRIPVDSDADAGREGAWTAMIEAVDTMTGFVLADLAQDDSDWDGTEADARWLPQCTDPSTGLWDVDSLITRDCGRDQVEGERVRVYGTVIP